MTRLNLSILPNFGLIAHMSEYGAVELLPGCVDLELEGGTAAGGYNTAAAPCQSDRHLLVNTQAPAHCKVAANSLLVRSLIRSPSEMTHT